MLKLHAAQVACIDSLPSGHNGTHLDAPFHFHPTINKGARAISIDEVDLDWDFQPGEKLNLCHFADCYVVTAEEVEVENNRIGHSV